MLLEQVKYFVENDPRTYIEAELRDNTFIVGFQVAHPGYETYYWLIWEVSNEGVEVTVQFNNGGTPHENNEADWWFDGRYWMGFEQFIEYVQTLPKPFTAWAKQTKSGPVYMSEGE